MKLKELRNLSKEDLIVKMASCKEDLGRLQYLKRIGQADKPHRFKELHHTIARILTILREEQLEKAAKTKDK